MARNAWPELADKPGALRQLILAGEDAIQARLRRAVAGRQQSIEQTSGVLTEVYGTGYLEEIRQDWP